MELLREYTITDKQLIAMAHSAVSNFSASNLSVSLCRAFRIKEIKDCVSSISDMNKRIFECKDVAKLHIYHQSKILKMNRLYAMLQNIDNNESELFINHEPVRIMQNETSKAKIFHV